MVGWHHQLNGHEFEQTPGDSEGQKSVVCFSAWDCRVGHALATDNNRLLKNIECSFLSGHHF